MSVLASNTCTFIYIVFFYFIPCHSFCFLIISTSDVFLTFWSFVWCVLFIYIPNGILVFPVSIQVSLQVIRKNSSRIESCIFHMDEKKHNEIRLEISKSLKKSRSPKYRYHHNKLQTLKTPQQNWYRPADKGNTTTIIHTEECVFFFKGNTKMKSILNTADNKTTATNLTRRNLKC